MSAVLSTSPQFTAHLVLAAGVTAYLQAPSLSALQDVVGKLQPTEAANEMLVGNGAQGRGPARSPAATAAPTDAPKPTAAASTPAADPAADQSQASTAAGDAGNGAAASPSPDAAAASTASSSEAAGSPVVEFADLKKAFLALSTKADGRAKCEAVLAPFKLAKLSAATPEQYAALLDAIEKAGK